MESHGTCRELGQRLGGGRIHPKEEGVRGLGVLGKRLVGVEPQDSTVTLKEKKWLAKQGMGRGLWKDILAGQPLSGTAGFRLRRQQGIPLILTISGHAQRQAFLQAAVLASVAAGAVNGAVLLPSAGVDNMTLLAPAEETLWWARDCGD